MEGRLVESSVSGEVKVRVGCRQDVGTLFDLVVAAAEAEQSSAHVRVTRESVCLDFHSGAFEFLVASIDGRVIGSAIFYPLYDVCRRCDYLYLDDLAVLEAYRGRGIGAKLFVRLLEIARERGAQAIDFQVLQDNDAAQRFYRRLGVDFFEGFVNMSLAGEALRMLAVGATETLPQPKCVRESESMMPLAGAGQDCVVRPATSSDTDAVISLVEELALFEGQENACGNGPLPLEKDAMKTGCKLQVLVAEEKSACAVSPAKFDSSSKQVVGMVVFSSCYASWTGRRLVMLALVVRESHRRRGVGSALVQGVCARAVSASINMLQWPALRTSTAAMEFYESRLRACSDASWLDASIPVS